MCGEFRGDGPQICRWDASCKRAAWACLCGMRARPPGAARAYGRPRRAPARARACVAGRPRRQYDDHLRGRGHSDLRLGRRRRRLQPRQQRTYRDAGRPRCHRPDDLQAGARLKSTQVQTKARTYFKAMFNRPDVKGLKVTSSLQVNAPCDFTVLADGSGTTSFDRHQPERRPAVEIAQPRASPAPSFPSITRRG
jgi:hypothetical protein